QPPRRSPLLPDRCKDDKTRRSSALDTAGWRVPRNAGSTASARASRLRRAALPAAWRSPRSDGAEPRGAASRSLHASPQIHTNNKQQSEQKITDDGVAEKHPTRRRAVLRQSHRERLNESCEIFRVTRIAQPGECVGNCVENCRSNNGSRQKCLQRYPILQENSNASDDRERRVSDENLRIDQRRAVAKIN